MENPTTIAIDLSKGVFEVAVERGGRTYRRRRLNRRQLAAFLSECVEAQWWVVSPPGGHKPVGTQWELRRALARGRVRGLPKGRGGRRRRPCPVGLHRPEAPSPVLQIGRASCRG